jgi:hypothetical protein
MTGCEAVREMLMDAARGVSADDSLDLHLENCPDCRRRLANERVLSVGLAAISSHAVPPASVRKALMAEFRRTHRPVPRRRLFVKWLAIAAAAVILLGLFISTRQRPQKTVRTAVVTPPPARAAPIVPTVAPKAPKAVKRRRAVKIQPPPPVETPEVATEFFEIPYTAPLRPEERGDVFRIEMPRANMAVFGLPVAGGRLDSRVTADVLIGEDGVMRAIRFIR